MKKLGLICATFLAVLLVAAPASAESAESISSFNSNIRVDINSQAQITETITYNFGNSQRHGIEREVPIKTQLQNGQFYQYDFKFIGALLDGGYVKAESWDQGAYAVIRVGDPDITTSGTHVYTLNYTISPTIAKDTKGDYFNWNITGNQWGVPIYSTSATVTFEAAPPIEGTPRCYSGASSQRTADGCTIDQSGNSINLTQDALGPYEGVTVDLLLPAQSQTTYLVAQDPPPFDWWAFSGVGTGVFIAFAGVVKYCIEKMKARMLRRDQIVVAQYAPPKDLSVAEVGQLTDSRASNVEVTATIIDLAVRGYLKIEQTKPKSLFSKAKYTIHRLKPASGLTTNEQRIYDIFFSGKEDSIELDKVSRSEAASKITAFKNELVKSLESKSVYESNKKANRAGKLKYVSRVALGVISVLVVIESLSPGTENTVGSIIFRLGGIFAGLVVYAVVTNRIKLTDRGYEKWAEVEGLKLYLTVAEKDRLNFHDAPEKTPEHFNKLLPYAIALGVEKKWAKQFADIDMEQDTSWYTGPRGSYLNTYMLTRSIGSEFSSSVSTSVAPVQSSSGYSGGSFSGGGGGGGGGGSW